MTNKTIQQRLDDLIKQATEEHSHFYVRSVAEDAKFCINELAKENEELRAQLDEQL